MKSELTIRFDNNSKELDKLFNDIDEQFKIYIKEHISYLSQCNLKSFIDHISVTFLFDSIITINSLYTYEDTLKPKCSYDIAQLDVGYNFNIKQINMLTEYTKFLFTQWLVENLLTGKKNLTIIEE